MAQYVTVGRSIATWKPAWRLSAEELPARWAFPTHFHGFTHQELVSFTPLVHRPIWARLVLRLRRSRWIDVNVPPSPHSEAPQVWRVAVLRCNGETDAEVLIGAQDHVRAELEALETLVQWRRDVPLTQRPAQWTYNLPDGTHAPCVYFLRNGTRVKIGTTTQIRRRVSRLALRPGNVALIVPGGRDTEQALHTRFATDRVGDTEWFEETASLRAFIETKRMEQLT